MRKIQDDPSVVQTAFEKLKESRSRGLTRPLEYRRQQLRNLLRGLEEMSDKLCEAWNQDLGGGKFAGQSLGHCFCVNETKECLDELDKWNATISKDTAFAVGPAKSYLTRLDRL